MTERYVDDHGRQIDGSDPLAIAARIPVEAHRGKRWDVEQAEHPRFKPRHCACCVDSGLHVTRER